VARAGRSVDRDAASTGATGTCKTIAEPASARAGAETAGGALGSAT